MHFAIIVLLHIALLYTAVEWSRFENFAPLVGRHLVTDTRCGQHEITDLEPACIYYVRVTVGNVRGFGPPSSTLIGIPSSKIVSFFSFLIFQIRF